MGANCIKSCQLWRWGWGFSLAWEKLSFSGDAVSKLLKLARSGDSEAIASLLGEKLESHGIWVMGQRRDEGLDLIVESLNGPKQDAIAPLITKAMQSLRPVGVRSLMLRGRRMGESSDIWQQTIPLTYIPPAEPEPEPVAAPVQPTPPPPEPAPAFPTAAPNALIDAAQQGQAGAISGLFAHEFRRDNVVVRTVVSDRRVTVRLSANKMPDQAALAPRVAKTAQDLDLPFMDLLRVEGYRRGQRDPIWTVDYEGGRLAEQARSPQVRSLDPDGRTCILGGLALGLTLALIPLTRILFGAWTVMVHELGHAIASLLFGYIAIPSFDFRYGGGITIPVGQIPLFTPLALSGFGYLCYHYRHNIPTQRLWGGILLLYGLASITALDQILITAMGHGGELVAIALCLYFALGRYFCLRSQERLIMAMLGWFTLFDLWHFGGQLLFSTTALANYLAGKGSLLDHDLVKLADQLPLVGVKALAMLLILLGGGAIAIAALAFRYEQWWMGAIARRAARDPSQLANP